MLKTSHPVELTVGGNAPATRPEVGSVQFVPKGMGDIFCSVSLPEVLLT